MSFPRYPEYKDSGLVWLGEVPAHWGVSQSRRMFAVRSEPAFPSDRMLTASQKYGVLYQSDFVAREGRRVVEVILGVESLRHVEPDDFIISMRSFQGGIEWCKLRGSTSFHYVMVTPVKDVYPAFFAHLFKSTLYIQALRTTTDLIRDGQELRYSNFAQVALPVIPIGEQEAIAGFLDRETAKIDALVAEQEKLITLLKEKRHAVISQAVTKGLDPTVLMKDSGVEWLGEIPAHWESCALKRIVELKSGESITAELIEVEGEYPVFGGNGLRGYTDRYTHDGAFALIGRQGALCGNINYANGKFWASEHAVVASPKAELNTHWLGELMRAMNLNQYSVSAAQPGLSVETIRNLKIPFPNPREQALIADFLGSESAKIDALMVETQSAITLLQERRSALISAAVTGQIDVRGLAQVEAA